MDAGIGMRSQADAGDELTAVERRAAENVPAPALDYCLGAAGDERTMVRNVHQLDNLTLIPRILPGTADIDTTVIVPGGQLAAPLLVAPMGLQALMHSSAERATAAAAAAAGLGHCLSTMSSASPAEVVAAAGPGLRWFQLYLLGDRRLTADLMHEAERLGFGALLVTVDVPVQGRRDRDRTNNFDRFAAAPPALLKMPRFQELVVQSGGTPKSTLNSIFPNPLCSWQDIAALIRSTSLPVIVKGVLHPDDALRLQDLGAVGVVVSTHGGRQFDRSISSIEALSRIRAAAGPELAVYLDSGVRRPAHVAIALALGADAVLLGRPVLMALAADGPTGVNTFLKDFVNELKDVMCVLGAPSIAALRALEVVA
jgi:isopentenyl diphosphate isomerase/L-lactate dehydrogenase-like FMN-dependent dehydrogenase